MSDLMSDSGGKSCFFLNSLCKLMVLTVESQGSNKGTTTQEGS